MIARSRDLAFKVFRSGETEKKLGSEKELSFHFVFFYTNGDFLIWAQRRGYFVGEGEIFRMTMALWVTSVPGMV